jgi:biopolymer transport protein ExbD
MAMGTGPSRGVKSEINVTPLVDVVLVLLIIFMVVTPMLQRGKDVRLPQAHKPDEETKEGDPLILSVTKDKRVFVEADLYDDTSFSQRVSQELTRQPGRKIVLKGDEALTFGEVRRVMDLARRAGARGIALGVEEMKAK